MGIEWKTNLNQLILLSWKNLRLQLKSPVGLALEILVPAIFAFILLPIRSIVKSTLYDEPTLFSPFKIETLPLIFQNSPIAYSPNNSNFISSIMSAVESDLKIKPIGKISFQTNINFY